jgi:uncharacterized protein (TIGR00369 family)
MGMIVDATKEYKELHNSDTQNCFACSPSNKFGLQMKLFTDEEAVYSWLSVPNHMGGWQNIVHGGIVSTILDEIMGWAGLYLLKKVTLTNSMTVDFIKALHVGERLRAEGRVIDYNGDRKVSVEGLLYNEKNELCAKSKGDFTALSPKLAKRIGMMTDDHIREFFEPLINQ